MRNFIIILLFMTPLMAEETALERLESSLEESNTIIKTGMKLGKRKEALEALSQKNVEMLEELVEVQMNLDQKDQMISDKEKVILQKDKIIAELSRSKKCVVEIFRQKFIGVSKDLETAKAMAYQDCGEKYDLQFQCRRVKAVCK